MSLLSKLKGLGHSRRVDVISPKLCDDILSYLEPSLRPYRGCHILDIGPGACLWSERLHRLLKPQTHVLLEPDIDRYGQFVEPLTRHDGSRYKHVNLPIELFATYEQIFDEGHLLKPIDTVAPAPTPPILVTGGLTWYPMLQVGPYSQAHAMLYQFLSTAINGPPGRRLFHRYGPVRMLLWILEEEKRKIVPRNILYRDRFNMELQAQCQVTEVAGAHIQKTIANDLPRDADLETLSYTRTLQKMTEAGINPPEGRQVQGSEFGAFPMTQNKAATTHHKTKKIQDAKQEKAAARRAKALAKKHELDEQISREAADFAISTISMERAAANSAGNSGVLSSQALEDQTVLRRETSELKSRLPLTPLREKKAAQLADNEAACRFEPHILQWDDRMYEPLVVEPSEFYPKHELALLDAVPYRLEEALFLDEDHDENARRFVAAVLLNPSKTLRQQLEAVTPGCSEALISQVPALASPLSGGRLDPGEMRVRMLTSGMLRGLVKAWREWLFRPATLDHLGELQRAKVTTA